MLDYSEILVVEELEIRDRRLRLISDHRLKISRATRY